MSKGDRYAKEALKKVAEWAKAYVENETTIPEMQDADLTDEEKGALMLLELMEKIQ